MKTNDVIDKVKNELSTLGQDLIAMRDEIRLKIHLAGMDAKEEWEKLEKQIEHGVAQAKTQATANVDELAKQVRAFAAKIPTAPTAPKKETV